MKCSVLKTAGKQESHFLRACMNWLSRARGTGLSSGRKEQLVVTGIRTALNSVLGSVSARTMQIELVSQWSWCSWALPCGRALIFFEVGIYTLFYCWSATVQSLSKTKASSKLFAMPSCLHSKKTRDNKDLFHVTKKLKVEGKLDRRHIH